jgi:hypothetical protein
MYLREVLSAPTVINFLAEGGNEFKNTQGVPTTKQNANEQEAEAALRALGQALKLPLEKYKTGSIIYPGAETGDADSVIDPSDYIEVDPALSPKAVQDQFREWLSARLSSAGYNELAKKATVDAPGKYFKIAGDGLTASVQIPGSKEWLQVDLDIAEPGEGEFSRWSKRGEPNPAGTAKGARAKGAFRHILKSGIARAVNPDWKWSFKSGLVDEKTGEQTKNPADIAVKLFGPTGTAADLDNISTILAKLKATRPQQYPEIVAKVNDGIAKMKYDYRLQ